MDLSITYGMWIGGQLCNYVQNVVLTVPLRPGHPCYKEGNVNRDEALDYFLWLNMRNLNLRKK